MFLPPQLTRAANDYVRTGANEDREHPRFPRKDFAGAVVIRGDILRYSSTSLPKEVPADGTGR